MKIRFEPERSSPVTAFEFYDSINRIPLSMKFSFDVGEGYYARNLNDENFIECKFLKTNRRLAAITIISADERSIKNVNEIKLDNSDGLTHGCYLEVDEELKVSIPMTYYRSSDAIQVSWYPQKDIARSFMIAERCAIGVTQNNTLASVTFLGLNEESIKQIFGF